MQVFDCEQGSPEWYELKRGVISSSEFQGILAKGEGKSRKKIIYQKAGERITGDLMQLYSNGSMQRGKDWEPLALELYQEQTGNEVRKCGFIRNGKFGASTDGLIFDGGVLEIKSRSADLQIELILKNEIPNCHKAQLQGEMLIADAEYADFVAYCRNMPLFIKRAYRDEEYLKILQEELEKAEEEIDKIIQEVMKRF